MKKILLSFGTIAIIAAPISAVISCNKKIEDAMTREDIEKTINEQITQGVKDELARIENEKNKITGTIDLGAIKSREDAMKVFAPGLKEGEAPTTIPIVIPKVGTKIVAGKYSFIWNENDTNSGAVQKFIRTWGDKPDLIKYFVDRLAGYDNIKWNPFITSDVYSSIGFFGLTSNSDKIDNPYYDLTNKSATENMELFMNNPRSGGEVNWHDKTLIIRTNSYNREYEYKWNDHDWVDFDMTTTNDNKQEKLDQFVEKLAKLLVNYSYNSNDQRLQSVISKIITS